MLRSFRRSCSILFLSASFSMPGVLWAQSQAGLGLEVNRYYGEQERALVEGAVEIPYTLLAFAPQGEALRASARVEVLVERAGGEQVYHTEREIHPEAANSAMAASDRVSTIETFAIYAPPGEYTARARVTDLASEKSYEMTTPFVVPSEPPFFSDILLSNHVQKDVRLQEGSYLPYLIGTTMFNPNPRNVFYKDAPLLYFYYEINPEAVAEVGETVELEMTVRHAGGEVVKNLGRRSIKVNEGRNFDLGAFNIGGLAAGRYTLDIRCTACPGGAVLSSDFEVRPPLEQLAFMQPRVEPAGGGAPALKYYADLSPAQVDSVVDVMEIWFTNEQKQLISTLNPSGKVQFLNRFWDGLDADPSIGDPDTPENEAKAMFEARVAHADQFFTSSQRLGRDTDRGRIYLLFGDPTERIDRPVEATLGPYVIWNYTSQGQTFAFGDFRRDGDYRLIYSTHAQFPGDPTIQSQVDDQPTVGRESFLPQGRGYEQIIEDIRTLRTSTGFQP
ncbi:MAG TPA: GWxTD domain-containing protein [Gemmatimonadota bacterium]|nr:GWxTD domain-containing protein [Gemmatimonadota bacterium]